MWNKSIDVDTCGMHLIPSIRPTLLHQIKYRPYNFMNRLYDCQQNIAIEIQKSCTQQISVRLILLLFILCVIQIALAYSPLSREWH